MTIDLKEPEGRALFLTMVESGDVVVENFAPGLMEKLGLDYETLNRTNPKIIVARVKGFGLSGPHHDYKSFDAAAAILAAYIQRGRTGKGQLVEVAMQEVVTNFLRGRDVDHYRDGTPSERRGNGLMGGILGGAYPCAPGGPNDYAYIYVQPMNEGMWRDFVTAIGRADLLTDVRCTDATTRNEIIVA